jgi:hypothetical protein
MTRPTLADIIATKNLNTDKNSLHSYCDHFYETELARYRDKPVDIVEIGINEGGSLMMWAEWFSQARILGVDLMLRGNCERDCSRYPNIMLSVGNAYVPDSVPVFPEADVIIDDGPHTLESHVFAVRNYLPKVRPGGVFIIEDVVEPGWFDTIRAAVPEHLRPYVQTVDLRWIKGRYDDLIFIVRVPEDLERNQSFTGLLRNPTGPGMDMMAERLGHLIPLIDFGNIRTIIDIGAAHGYESLNMARVFTNARVHAFEPTPGHYEHCIGLFSQQPTEIRSRITIDNMALNDRDGPIKFYPLDETRARSSNTGVASKYQFMDPGIFGHELNIQKEIEVPAACLDTMCRIRGLQPDIIWMDAQGSELDILTGGIGIALPSAKIIMTEAGIKPYYAGQSLKPDIDRLLEESGFVELATARRLSHEYEVDTIYVRNDLLGS